MCAITLLSNPLQQFEWQYRVIIVNGMNHQPLVEKLIKDTKGFEERRLLLINLQEHTVAPDLVVQADFYDEVQKTLKVAEREVVLVGLDGLVKIRQTDLLTKDVLYRQIDAMPMRRAEKK